MRGTPPQPPIHRRNRFRRLLSPAVLCAPLACHAGPSLDETTVRHRVLQAPGATDPTLSPIEIEVPATTRQGITAAHGGPGDGIPPLVRPVIRNHGGLRLRVDNRLADGAVDVRLGVAWQPGDAEVASFDGSRVAVGFGVGRLYASVERRHWGPAWTASLILDGGSRPVPAVGWRKADPAPFETPLLSWLGPWNADFFAGVLSQDGGPRHAQLLGGRVQIMPLRGLELAVSRTIQWGGSGRPRSARSLFDALVGRGDNVDAAGDNSNEPGNQLAGFDARYTLRLRDATSFSLYGQAIGEDQAGGWPSRYLASAGIDAAFTARGAGWRVFVERADTTLHGAFGTPILGVAYRHHIYAAGYTQRGSPLGHPAGGDVRLTSLGVLGDAGRWTALVVLHRGDAYRTAQLYAPGGNIGGLDAQLAWRLDADLTLGLALFRWRDPQAHRTRGQLWAEWAFR